MPDFDLTYTAEGKMFTAVLRRTAHTWRADIKFHKMSGAHGSRSSEAIQSRTLGKYGKDHTVQSFTEDGVRDMLRKMDKTVQFFSGRYRDANGNREERRNPNAASQSADEVICENLRVDSSMTDAAYISACKKLGVTPKARPVQVGRLNHPYDAEGRRL